MQKHIDRTIMITLQAIFFPIAYTLRVIFYFFSTIKVLIVKIHKKIHTK